MELAPDHPGYRKDLLHCHLPLMFLAAQTGDRSAAAHHMTEAAGILEGFQRDGLFTEDEQVLQARALFDALVQATGNGAAGADDSLSALHRTWLLGAVSR